MTDYHSPTLSPDEKLERKNSLKENKSQKTNMKPEDENIKPKPFGVKKKLFLKEMMFPMLCKGSLMTFCYFIGLFNFSFVLIPILLGTILMYEQQKKKRKHRILSKAKGCSISKEELLNTIGNLPTWVTYPDRERAEWLNEILLQMWPSLNQYIIKFFKGTLEKKIRKKYESFRFEEMDFGDIPPKIDGVKVYNRTITKDSIIIDFDVYYDGNCEVNCSISGAHIGSLKDFQVCTEVRVVLKPIMTKLPLIGGIQVFFLNTPDLDFSLEGITNMPGFSYFIRTKIEEKLRKLIVFPNKFCKRIYKSIEASELKSFQPEGVLRVHVAEARLLEKMDVTGKSDPYAILKIGAQERRTKVVYRSLNPKWDYWCEFFILDPYAQQVKFTLYDQDDYNEDDFLGSGEVDLKSILTGNTDQWVKLEGVDHGEMHLRFTWLTLSSDYNTLDKALEEAKLLKVPTIGSSVLTVYVESAHNLPTAKSHKKPEPFVVLTIGSETVPYSEQQKSKVKKYTVDPVWDQGFSFMVINPEEDYLHLSIIDKNTKIKLDQFEYPIRELAMEPDLQISKREFSLNKNTPDSHIILSLQLRVLINDMYQEESQDEDSSDSNFEDSRNDSFKTRFSSAKTRLAKSVSSKSRESHESMTPSINEEVAPQLFYSSSHSSPAKKENLGSILESEASFEATSFGKLLLTLEYSEPRQKFMITVNKLSNLPAKSEHDLPDPYVKLKIASPLSTMKNRTKIIMDNCNPEFNETFEYLLSPSELLEQKIIATVKTKKKFFAKNTLGQVIIYLNNIDLDEPHMKWYHIEAESHSD